MAAIILSGFEMVSAMVPKLPQEVLAEQGRPMESGDPPSVEGAQEKIFFGNLFNLSAALANAPQNVSALGFVPLGSLLFGAAG